MIYVLMICCEPAMMSRKIIGVIGLSVLAPNHNISEFWNPKLNSAKNINQLETFKSLWNTIIYVLMICSQPAMMSCKIIGVIVLSVSAPNHNIWEFWNPKLNSAKNINQLETFKSLWNTIIYVVMICSQPTMMSCKIIGVIGLSVSAPNQNISSSTFTILVSNFILGIITSGYCSSTHTFWSALPCFFESITPIFF